MDLSQIKIATRDPSRKIWLVRADGGYFFEYFRAGSIISIKHLDQFYDFKVHGSEIPSSEVIQDAILRKEKYRSKNPKDTTAKLNASGRRSYNQILHFINDIKQGDLVVSLNDSLVAIGICASSEAYFSDKPILFPKDDQDSDFDQESESESLPHTLRKRVLWGPVVKRKQAESLLRAPFRCQQTISRLDEYWKELYSLIYPFYTDGEHLYFSNFIGTRSEINGKVVSRLFSNLSDVELIFQELLAGKINKDSINRIVYGDLSDDQLYSLTTKAFFMSPGGVNSKIPLPQGIDQDLALKGLALLFLIATGLISVDSAASSLPTDNQVSLYNPSGMIDERLLEPSNSNNVDRMLGELINENEAQLKKIKKLQQVSTVRKKLRITIPTHETEILESSGSVEVKTVIDREE